MRTLIALLLVTALGLFAPPQAQAQTNISGAFTFNGAIYLHTAIPAGDVVFCEVTLGTSDANGVNSESVLIEATLKSGSTYTCSPAIHYYWHLDTPTTDIVSISWTVGIGPSSTTSAAQLVRTGTHSLPVMTGVPASGTSWTKSDDCAL